MGRGFENAEIQQLGRERDQAIILLCERLNRYRNLLDDECALLDHAISRERRADGAGVPNWSPVDDEKLRSLFSASPVSSVSNWEAIGENLDPPRTPFAVKRRIAVLGLSVAEHRSMAGAGK